MNTPIRHGEIVFKPVNALPKGAKRESEHTKLIVGHSETGHHHVLEATKSFKIWTCNGGKYIEVPEIAELWHQKTGQDVHKTLPVAPGFYKIDRKQEFDYFAGKLRQVRD